jgi:hypothetical protein
MKRYKIRKAKDGSIAYHLSDKDRTVTLTLCLSPYSNTFYGVEMKAMDDAWGVLRDNPQLYEARAHNIEETIEACGFERVDFFTPEGKGRWLESLVDGTATDSHITTRSIV